MQYRKLGKTNWDVSEIGFGAWGIGKAWWGKTDDSESLKALNAAWNSGINFYDTAFVYGDGHSEELLGRALKGKPAVIATKIPPKNQRWPADPKSKADDIFPKNWIVSRTERSLKKLNRECIDLTQFHVWTDAWMAADEWKDAVSTLKRQGKIRAFGVSINDHDPGSALQLVASGLVDTVQVIFNIFDQSPTEHLFPLCQQNNVGVIVRVPFDEGGLTGTLTRETRFDPGDFRSSYFKGDNLAQTVDRVERLKSFVGNGIKSLPELALRFVLSHDPVSVVIPGMRTVSHVEMNARVSDGRYLSAEKKKALASHAWDRNFYREWTD